MSKSSYLLLLLALLAGGARAAESRADKARRALEEQVAFLQDDELRAELERLGGELRTARQQALEFLFDAKRYPVPKKASKGWRVGIDLQPGHEEMERRVSAAIVLHNRVMQLLAKQLEVKTRTVGASRPTLKPPAEVRTVSVYGILVIDTGVAKFLKSYRAGFDPWRKLRGRALPAGRDVFLYALGNLSREKWKEAAASGRTLQGAEGIVWEALRAAALLNWNERFKARHDNNEHQGMRVLNAYRVSLGLPPLALNTRLHYMAGDFATEMKRLRFFSHNHPADPSRRTLGRRAKRAGYKGLSGENVSSEGNAAKAVWNWRADGAHHRLLVLPYWRAAGFGCPRPSVLNVGTSTRAGIHPLYGVGRPRRR